jgi:hypothetical protein
MELQDRITYFAETDYRGQKKKFGIKANDRTRHVYVIGKTGMGKSTLLENMAVQDIQNGAGMGFIDPHGKSAELVLDYIPRERIKDVVYFAPFDLEHPISFNIMEDVGADKRHLVVNGLIAAFKKIWIDAWSARMEYILTNTILALLEYPGSTLLGVNKMLTDKAYRKKVVDATTDPTVKAFWVDEFANYTDRYTLEATPAIQNKIGQFTSNPLIRNIVGQPTSSFDIRRMMDEGKILIMNLSKGRVGEQNSNLIGSMLIIKIYLAAMSRADASEATLAKLPNFYFFIDEFQSFSNESFIDILSEARKYKLNLTIAHQYIEQMPEEVRAAVFGNVGTLISFRVGSYDAEVLEKEFSPRFSATDIVNLGFAQIYLRLMIDGIGSQPFSATTLPPIAPPAISYKNEVIASSRELYTRPRAEVEQVVRESLALTERVSSEKKAREGAQPVRHEPSAPLRAPRSTPAVSVVAPVKTFVPSPRPVIAKAEAPRVSPVRASRVMPSAPVPAVPKKAPEAEATLSSLKRDASPRAPSKNLDELRNVLRDALAGAPKEQSEAPKISVPDKKTSEPVFKRSGILKRGASVKFE